MSPLSASDFSLRQFCGLMACVAILTGCGIRVGSDGNPGFNPSPNPTNPGNPNPPGTGPVYTVGGTLAGLASGATLVLGDNFGANLSLTTNGSFSFPTQRNSGLTYSVTVQTPPASPSQTCTVTNGSGSIGSSNVTNVQVECATNSFTVGGTVSGLSGGTVVLQLNGANDLSIDVDGMFTFTGVPLLSGTTYAVTVLTNPVAPAPAQTCTVTNGSGTIGAGDVTSVEVVCVTNSFTVGGMVSGLSGGTVTLQLNGADDLSISADGMFTFPDVWVLGGQAYAVTVLTEPTAPGPGQTCTVTNGSGTIAAADVTDVLVTCANIDQVVPVVLALDPLPTAVGSRIQGGVVTVTFSEAMDTATVTSSSFILEGPSGPVAGTISFAAGDTQAIFTPDANLTFDESYTARLTSSVADPSGNPLAEVEWTFDTGKKLAFGFRHTCARFDNGRVKCWGANHYGQLGYGDTQNRGDGPGEMGNALPFVDLGTGRTAVAITAGDYHSCVILDNGDSKCWGRNYVDGESVDQGGALGQGVTGVGSDRGDNPNEMGDNLPGINLGVGRRALQLVGAQNFTCARLDDDTVKCWGINNLGQLGQGTGTPLGAVAGDIAAADPVDFGTGLTPVSITLGHHNGCAILVDGAGGRQVKCWGGNNWGQLGLGDVANRGDGPSEMGDNLPAVQLGTGLTPETVLSNGGHNCAVLVNNVGVRQVKCWGLNTWGQLGRTDGISLAPAANENARLSCAGGAHDCIGDVAGEMGDQLPSVSAIGSGVARLTMSYRHVCVRPALNDNQLFCWGSNQQGQLGLIGGSGTAAASIIGDEVGEASALEATALIAPVIEEATAGGFHSCVSNTDGTLNCWGANSQGQLGHGGTAIFGDGNNEMASLPNTDLGT